MSCWKIGVFKVQVGRLESKCFHRNAHSWMIYCFFGRWISGEEKKKKTKKTVAFGLLLNFVLVIASVVRTTLNNRIAAAILIWKIVYFFFSPLKAETCIGVSFVSPLMWFGNHFKKIHVCWKIVFLTEWILVYSMVAGQK